MNEIKITIRKATLSDLDVLLGFEQEVVNAERPFDITLKDENVRYYDLEELISAPHVELVVAESGSEIIGSGYARLETSEPYLKHQKHAYLGFMYVVPTYRRKGVNKEIIEVLKQWSVSQNVTEMRLEVYVNNLAAIRAYERAGFEPHMLEMRMSL